MLRIPSGRGLESASTRSSGGRMMPMIPATLLCGGLLIGIALTLLRFPVAPLALAGALGLYFWLLLRYQKLWAFVITARSAGFGSDALERMATFQ